MPFSYLFLYPVLSLLWLFLMSFCPPAGASIFEECDHELKLVAKQKFYINSPRYPDPYPPGSSCRFVINAPPDHIMKFTCDIEITSQSTSRCTDDVFYFNGEGSKLTPNSNFFCGSGSVERKSYLNHAVISYVSKPSNVYSRSRENFNQFLRLMGSMRTTATSNSPTTRTTKKKKDQETTEEKEEGRNNTVNSRRRRSMMHPAPAPLKSVLDSDLQQSNSSSRVRWSRSTSRSTRLTAGYVSDSDPTSSSGVEKARVSSTVVSARIVSGLNTASPATSDAVVGGSFSCLVEVQEPPCECGWSVSPKVAGQASEASIDEFPPMAGLFTLLNNKVFCGATIIHHRYLISAAHCFQLPGTQHPHLIRAAVGEHDVTKVAESVHMRSYEIESIIRHEEFISSADVLTNDIALLRTRYNIEWSRSVGPACLPFPPVTRPRKHLPLAGQRLDTAGWGTTSFGGRQSLRLLKTTLDVIPSESCRRALFKLSPRTFCTYTPGSDTCQYDSGGALYMRGSRLYAVGIISYGFACAAHQPSVNTRLSAFLKWIQRKTPEVKYCRR